MSGSERARAALVLTRKRKSLAVEETKSQDMRNCMLEPWRCNRRGLLELDSLFFSSSPNR